MPENPHFDTPSNDAELDPLEAYLDDELGDLERRRFERRLLEEPALAAELELARRVRGGLRSMRRACPPEVVRRVETHLEKRGLLGRLEAFFAPRATWLRKPQPALAALALVALLSAALISLPGAWPSSYSARSTPGTAGAAPGTTAEDASRSATTTLEEAEIEQARREVELAFAYLGQLGRTAETSVRRLAADPPGGGGDDAS